MKYIILFCLLFVSIFSFGQDLTRKEKRRLIKQIRKGDIPVKKDTLMLPIAIHKDSITPSKPILVPDKSILVPILQYRDTCLKSRYELRNDRKIMRIEASKEVTLAKEDNKKTDILADKMKDSLNLIIKLSKIELDKIKSENKKLRDSLNAQIKLVRASSRGEVWGNIKTIAIVLLLTVLVLIFFYILKPIFFK
jgi:hypothetical protein